MRIFSELSAQILLAWYLIFILLLGCYSWTSMKIFESQEQTIAIKYSISIKLILYVLEWFIIKSLLKLKAIRWLAFKIFNMRPTLHMQILFADPDFDLTRPLTTSTLHLWAPQSSKMVHFCLLYALSNHCKWYHLILSLIFATLRPFLIFDYEYSLLGYSQLPPSSFSYNFLF